MSEFKLVPDKNRIFTTVEIADALNTNRPTIYHIASLKGIECTIGAKRVKYWTYSDFKQIKEYLELHKKQPKKQVQKAPELPLEELQKLHPLVKNTRWFKLSDFPDIIPKGYENLEEEIV